MVTLFLAGDVMIGRGVDQVLPHPCPPHIYERAMVSAEDYVLLAEQRNGPIPRGVGYAYPWGDGLAELARQEPVARVVNLETAITHSEEYEFKGINYRVSPENANCLAAAGIDCCVLANNHVLDWGTAGLRDTLATLDALGIRHTGAGRDAARAAAPAILPLPGGGRLLVFAWGLQGSGVPHHWAAAPNRPGVNFLGSLAREELRRAAGAVRPVKQAGDIAVASLHWGPNFGYRVGNEERAFAHALIDEAGIDLVYGHSSHHPKGVEVYHGRLVLYGCGDLLNDYEGIEGYEEYRPDLVLMYFPQVSAATGALEALEMTPFRLRNFRLERASAADAAWLATTLTREGAALGTQVQVSAGEGLRLHWADR